MFKFASLYNMFKSYFLPIFISAGLILSPACGPSGDSDSGELADRIKKLEADIKQAEEKIRSRSEKEKMAIKGLKEAEIKLSNAEKNAKAAQDALQKANTQAATQQQAAQAAQATAQTQYAQSQAALQAATTNLNAAQAKAQQDAASIATLQAQALLDQASLQQANANLNAAQAQTVQDAAAIAAAQAQYAQSQMALQQANVNLQDAQTQARQAAAAIAAAQSQALRDLQDLQQARQNLNDAQDQAQQNALEHQRAIDRAQQDLQDTKNAASKQQQQDTQTITSLKQQELQLGLELQQKNLELNKIQDDAAQQALGDRAKIEELVKRVKDAEQELMQRKEEAKDAQIRAQENLDLEKQKTLLELQKLKTQADDDAQRAMQQIKDLSAKVSSAQQELSQAKENLKEAQKQAQQNALDLAAQRALTDTQMKAARQAQVDADLIRAAQARADKELKELQAAQKDLDAAKTQAQQKADQHQQTIVKLEQDLQNNREAAFKKQQEDLQTIAGLKKQALELQSDLLQKSKELKNTQDQAAKQSLSDKAHIAELTTKIQNAQEDAKKLGQQSTQSLTNYQQELEKLKIMAAENAQQAKNEIAKLTKEAQSAKKDLIDKQQELQDAQNQVQAKLQIAQRDLQTQRAQAQAEAEQHKQAITKVEQELQKNREDAVAKGQQDAQTNAEHQIEKIKLERELETLKNEAAKNVQAADQKIAELTKKAQSSETDLLLAKKELQDVQQTAKLDANAAAAALDQASKDLQELQKAQKELQDINNQIRQKNLQYEQTINNTNQELLKLKGEAAKKAQQDVQEIADFKKQDLQLQQELQQKQKELKKLQAQALQESLVATARIDYLTKEVQDARSQLSKTQDELKNAQAQNQQNLKDLAEEQQKAQKAEQRLKDMQKTITDLQEAAQSASADLDAIRAELTQAKKEAQGAQADLDKAQKDAAGAQVLITQAEDAAKEAQAKFEKAVNELKLSQGEVTNLKDILTKLKESNLKLESDLQQAYIKNIDQESRQERAIQDSQQQYLEIETLKLKLAELQKEKDQLFNEKIRYIENKELLDKANMLLNGRSYMEFFGQESANVGQIKALEKLREIFFMQYRANKDAGFCDAAYAQLKIPPKASLLSYPKFGLFAGLGDKWITWNTTPEITVLKELVNVCMNKGDYSHKYFETLKRIKSTPSEEKEDIESISRFINMNFKKYKGRIWGEQFVALKNKSWIVNSPLYKDSARLELDENHSQNFIDAWAKPVAKAENFVDITTLSPPGKAFMDALKSSLKDIQHKPITIRILLGGNSKTYQTFDVRQITKDLTSDLANDAKLKVIVGAYSILVGAKSWLSWNHSKIVAVDGKYMFTGGHNLYDAYVDIKNPTHDLSVTLTGKIAHIGHSFSNEIWDYVASKGSNGEMCTFTTRETSDGKGREKVYSLEKEAPPRFDTTGSDIVIPQQNINEEKVIALGRLGDIDTEAIVSDGAIARMIEEARVSLFISQQATLQLFHKTSFNEKVVNGIVKAILKKPGVDVYILSSSTKEEWVGAGLQGYTGRHDPAQTWAYIYDAAVNLGHKADEVAQALFKHLQVLPTANNKHEVPNHAKVVIADGSVAYDGSHNLYDDSHGEFGVILGELASQELVTDYFSPLWLASTQQGEPLQADLKDYKVGEYVYVQRSKLEENHSHNWTVAEVVNVSQNPERVWVNLDFLRKFDPISSRPRKKLITKEIIHVPGKIHSGQTIQIPESILRDAPLEQSDLN